MQTSKPLRFAVRRSTPVILQTEAAECGLACVAMVAGHYGHDLDLMTLRRDYPVSLKGMTLQSLMEIAGRLRLTPRPVKLELVDLGRLVLPAVLHWNFNHFVVITRVSASGAEIIDPGRGKRQVSLAELSKHFTGVAMELVPAADFEPRNDKLRVPLRTLLGNLPGWGGAALQILSLAAALEVFTVAAPFYLQWVVDEVVVARDRDLLTVLGVGFLLLAVFQILVSTLRGWVVLVLGTTLNVQLLSNLFRRLLRLPLTFFEKRHLGDIVSRFESLNAIQRTLTGAFIEALLDGVMAGVTLVMMVVYQIKLAGLVVLVAVGYGLVRWALFGALRSAQEEEILRGAKQQSHLLETIRGIPSVKLFGRENLRLTSYQNLMVDHVNAHIRVQRLQLIYKTLNGLLFGIEHIAVIWLAAGLILDNQFSVGMLFAFAAYKEQFTSRIIGFIEKSIEFRMLGLHTERVADIALAEPEPERGGAWLSTEPAHFDLEVQHLSFRYADGEPWVLRDLSLAIKAGESVALVGPSGCGKTTLLKVLLGLLPTHEGRVLVGGIDIQQLGLANYRRLVGAVMQDDQLFAGSIADNIAFFDGAIDRERVETCARLAALHDDIVRMPMGYNTLVGDMGTALSGGQKQRLLLARALYHKPKILFLDEATSHLDVQREHHVSEAIRQLQITRVIIAHRPETIASVDRVIALAPDYAWDAGPWRRTVAA